MATIVKRIDPATLNLKEQVVAINRVTKVVKGGKNLSFSALVVIGDPQAKVVGYGVGKAKEVPSAIRKGIEAAKKNLRKVHVLETTIAHRVLGQYASSQVLLKPAAAGTCLLYTSDAADDLLCVDLGGRRIIKKKKKKKNKREVI